MRLRRRTTCSVPGHGTWCEPSTEKGDRYERCTEERMALDYELSADDKSTPGPADTPGRGSTGPGHSRPAGDDVGDEDPTYTQAHEDSR